MRRHYCLAGEGNHGTSDARDTEQTGRAEGAFIFLCPRPPSLQIVSSILQLQLPDVEGKGAADAMRSAAARVLAIAAVHERLYTGEEAMVVRLDMFLHDLCHENW
ncbi:MAG TPA: histidine kinase dimerization/phosphoacceptor domain -containing protein [Pseudolabrys sp.]|nr:histidine kinase dimerization/phosphoacceptor domain -containing protein [Pseudolabrys sp.]